MTYQDIKNTIATEETALLIETFKLMELNEDSTMEETLIYTALTTELENRGAIRLNGWEYEIVE